MEPSNEEERGPGKNKKKWTDEEDAKLIDALVDMVNSGKFKAEGGFKPGYLNFLEAALQSLLPHAGIKAKPHIESRLKTLKRDFNVVYDMLNGKNTSGFGWDATEQCLTAEKNVWDDYLKAHLRHSGFKNKSFPKFDDLCIIFGKDRATGVQAETPADVVEAMNEDVRNDEENDEAEDVANSVSVVHGVRKSPTRTSEEVWSKNQKGKRDKSDDGLVSSIREAAEVIGKEISKASEKFTEAIGVEAATADKRRRIHAELLKIPHLTPRESIKAACALARDHELTDVFFSVESEHREEMVRALLAGDI